MLRFASSMGELHYIGAGGTGDDQLLRYWGEQFSMGTGLGGGLLSNRSIVEGNGYLRTPQLVDQNTWIIQGAFFCSANLDGGAAQNAGLALFKAGTEQLRLLVAPVAAFGARQEGQLYRLELRRGATLLATSTASFYAQQWHIIQMKVTIDPVAGAYEVRVAPVENTNVGAFSTVLSGGPTNTADAGVAGADQVEVNYEVNNSSCRWDHFFVMDDTGAVNNDFPGKWLLVHGVLPNRQGAQNDWVSQGGQGSGANDYESVNDPGNSIQDDIGRHTSDTPGAIFLVGYQVPGTTGNPGAEAGHPIGAGANVQGVIFHHVSGMENSGTRTVRPIYRNSVDVRAEGGDVILSTPAYAGYFEVFEQDPVAAAAWTAQGVIDMQWGLKVQS